jgi:hypothetical protein
MLSAEFVVGMKNIVSFVLVTFASCCCCCKCVLFLGCKLVCDSLIAVVVCDTVFMKY